MINDVLRETEGKMKKSVEALRQHLTTIRTGRASPALVEHMHVEAYGSPMPMNQLAGISTPDARQYAQDVLEQMGYKVHCKNKDDCRCDTGQDSTSRESYTERSRDQRNYQTGPR